MIAADTKQSDSPYARWQQTVSARYKDRSFVARNRSGLEVEPVYGGLDRKGRDSEMPGQYPYTRGIYPIHYQYQPWMDLQIIGFGLPAQTRERMDLLLEQGGSKGYFDREAYNFIFDMPTSMGYDPDHPGVRGSIGDCGISVCKASDYEVLLAGKDLAKTTVSLVLNAGSPAMLGLYLAAAKRRGFAFDKLGGNLTNYIWDFFGHSGGTNFSPRGSYRLIADIAAYCAEQVPLWNPLTISEHNICEAGADNVQAVAYSIAAIIAVNEECVKLGIEPDKVVPRFGFHVRYGENFFEEVAKTRALRRVYAKVNKERFGCTKSGSLQARIHAQTAGSLLTAQQPLNNLVRNAYGALAAVLSGANGMTINAYDEALGLPTEEAVTLSLRTSQIIAEETGAVHVSDPFGGSYYIESLTDDIERKVFEIVADIDDRGGLIACIESGWIKQQVSAAAYQWRQEVESGARTMVGVNKYTTDEPEQYAVFQPDPEAARLAIADIERHRRERDNAGCTKALERLRCAALEVSEGRAIGSVMENLVAAAEADATLGEMQAILHEVFGRNNRKLNDMQDDASNPRVLLTKSFIDSHDRAIATIALALRDAAMEVVLIDYEQPEDVVTVALQEDVDIIGISFMSGGQVETTQKIVAELQRRDVPNLPVVVGGVIRPFDVAPLEAVGVREIFRGGAPLADVVATFQRLARAYREIA